MKRIRFQGDLIALILSTMMLGFLSTGAVSAQTWDITNQDDSGSMGNPFDDSWSDTNGFSDSWSSDFLNGTGNENSSGTTESGWMGAWGEGSVNTSFSDISDSFARDDIAKLAAKGIINGYSDGTFRPDVPTTRAEFLAIALRAMDIPVDTSTESTDFSDVGPAWAPYVAKVREYGINGETVNGRQIFRPNDPITRAEAVKVLLSIAWLDVASIPLTQSWSEFSDVTEDWMVTYVETAKDLGIVNGQEADGQLVFRPNDPITRAEAVKIIAGITGQ